MTAFQQITYDVRDQVATITLNRPAELNAATPLMLSEIVEAFDRTDSDDGVRCVVVAAAGGAFCAGADLPTLQAIHAARDPESTEVEEDPGGLTSLRIHRSLKPVIGAINGAAVGVGVTMTLPMDIRLASEHARFGFVFARRGVMLEAASAWFLPRLVGISRAAEWVYTGRVFSAQEALSGGLVRSVHAPEDLLSAAYALAREIADNTAPVSVALSRQAMWRMLSEASPYAAHVADSRALNILGRSADTREGIRSFLEKRPPRFTGSVRADLPDIFGDPQPDWAVDHRS